MTSIIWSIAGTDSGGGAGLSADQRAVEAFAAAWQGRGCRAKDADSKTRATGLHLCPVVACITAQNSLGVARVEPVAPAVLDAQLQALSRDMPPDVIKTGLIGSAELIEVLAQGVERLRAMRPAKRLWLVVDPVLRASTGKDFADDALLHAYRTRLLPLADVITPNRAEATRLLGQVSPRPIPDLALTLRGLMRVPSEASVLITGGDVEAAERLDAGGLSPIHAAFEQSFACDWLHAAAVRGWLYAPRVNSPHHHGTGCTFASGLAAALALRFAPADAAVLAKMLVASGLKHGVQPGQGPGVLRPQPDFALQLDALPCLSWPDDALPDSQLDTTQEGTKTRAQNGSPMADAPPQQAKPGKAVEGLYAIVGDLAQLHDVLQAGYTEVQWRMKAPPSAPPDWHDAYQADLAQALAACHHAGARLWVNDHWRVALALGAEAVHLGQEDLASLRSADRVQLRGRAASLQLGISSHALWELCRAAHMQPSYIACGPVWPTTTKNMPWLPQGLENLSWWAAVAPAPVVGIGGVLEADQVASVAHTGAAAVVLVRGLQPAPEHDHSQRRAKLLQAWQTGLARATHAQEAPCLPHPTLS